MQSSLHSRRLWKLRFWLLTSFLCLLFLTGGGSRVDVASLVVLRPVSVLMCAAALVSLRREHWEGRRWLLVLIGAIIGLNLLHVVPLPPAVWQAFPGREEIAATDRLAGLGDIWRPLTLTPMNGWHSLSALFAPLAVILLGLQLQRQEVYRLLLIVLALGIMSGLFGLVQIIGGGDGPLYLYRITNSGSAVGLFANRNHAAAMLAMLFPMLAIFASTPGGTSDRQEGRRILAFAAAIVLLPLILVTGSRAGLVLAAVGLASAFFLYRRPPEGRKVRHGGRIWKPKNWGVIGGIAIAMLGVVTIVLSKAQSIERLAGSDLADESRFDFWAVSIDMFRKYFPFGSGSGSFADAFRILEPDWMLNSTYVNHAHNDWLELAVTFGVPGMLLLAAILAVVIPRGVRSWRADANRRSIQFARLATVLMAMLALASIIEYPLRTPIMMGLLALFGLWLAEPEREDAAGQAVEREG